MLDHPSAEGQRFRLPAWTPGSYLIREFARHVIDVRAETSDGAVSIDKETKDVARRVVPGAVDRNRAHLRIRSVGAHRVSRLDTRLFQRRIGLPVSARTRERSLHTPNRPVARRSAARVAHCHDPSSRRSISRPPLRRRQLRRLDRPPGRNVRFCVGVFRRRWCATRHRAHWRAQRGPRSSRPRSRADLPGTCRSVRRHGAVRPLSVPHQRSGRRTRRSRASVEHEPPVPA